MGHKNYSNFSKHFNKTEDNNQNTELNNEVLDGEITIDEVSNDSIVSNETEQNEVVDNELKVSIGYVVDCEKLYVRSGCSKESEPVTIINKDSDVRVELTESTNDFYKVVTNTGIEGYCMKKYIMIPKTAVE